VRMGAEEPERAGGGKRRAAAWSLPELLIVCAVVAALGALAMPAFSSSRMTANRVKCASNLRQIGSALLLYAGEHNGLLPVTSHTTGDSTIRLPNGERLRTIEYSWVYLLAGYLGDVDAVRICPADEPERQERIRKLHATSYLLNDIVFDAEEGTRLQSLPFPARTALAFISNRPVSRTWDHAHGAEWTTWAALNADIAPDRHRVGERSPDRLNGSSNYLYADGHVAVLEARELRKMLDAGVNPAAIPREP